MSKIVKSSNHGVSTTGTKKKLDLTKSNIAAFGQTLSKFEIPRLFYQLVVFVLDGSGSMTFPGTSGKSKGVEVENAVKKVIKRLQESKNKNSFDLTAWAYANESVEMFPLKKVTEVDFMDSLNPCEYIDDYSKTDLLETLESVEELCKEYLSKYKDKDSKALIIILSDGALHNFENTYKVVERLKANEKITISTILFESRDWEEEFGENILETLKENLLDIATDEELFASTVDPEQVRKHMIKSVSTVSKLDQ
jgi:hypothetical protein